MTPVRKNKFYSLRSRLILMAMAVIIFPMLLAAAFAFFSQKEQIRHSLKRELNASHSACLLYLHGLREKLELTTMATANDNTCKTTLRLGVLPQLQQQLGVLAQEYKMDFLLATNTSGEIVALYPPLPDPGADISRHPLIIQALEGKHITAAIREDHPQLARAAAGGPEKWQQKTELLLESAFPIRIRDTLTGAILAGVRLSGKDQLMQAMQQTSDADQTALVMDGKIVAASFPYDQNPHQRLINMLDGRETPVTADSLPLLTCQQDGKRKVFKASDITGPDKSPVAALVTMLDYDRAETLITDAVLRVIALFLAAMLTAVIIAYFVARSIASPVNALSQAMREMVAGTLRHTALPVERNDEIGILIQGFNTMATQIQTYTHGLEKEIKERINTEKSLAEEKERLAVTLRSIGDAVITTDIQGNIVFINKVAEELTGWSNEEVQGQALSTTFLVIDEKTGAPCTSLAQQVLTTGQTATRDGNPVLITRDNTLRNIASSGAPILDLNNRIIGVVIVFRDITHDLKMEEELIKIKKLESIGVLAGGIAHDFNNTLTAVLGNIEMAVFYIAGKDEKASSLLIEAKKAVKRASNLTKQLLTFSKGGSPVKDSASLPDIIHDSVSFVLHGSNIACEYHFPADLWMAEVDCGQIGQVIQNIIINAKHAMPEGGKIVISGTNITNAAAKETLLNTHDRNFVKITITDTGRGISPDIIDKIFDPYFTTKQEGSGLGLAICYSIIRKHNGYLTVQSEPGQGTTFIIHLPANPASAIPAAGTIKQTPEAPEALAAPITSARVMVLDDEQIIRDIVKAQLTALGHEAVLVTDGAEAIRVYEEFQDAKTPIDLVLMDLTIPAGMGGKEAARLLLQRYPDARLIVSSGYSDDPVMANFRDYGFRAALSKPYNLEQLQHGIQETLQ